MKLEMVGVENEKLKSSKLECLQLGSFCFSWKESSEVNFPSFIIEAGKYINLIFQFDISEFNRSFPTSLVLFNSNLNYLTLGQKLSNFGPNFPISFRTLKL